MIPISLKKKNGITLHYNNLTKHQFDRYISNNHSFLFKMNQDNVCSTVVLLIILLPLFSKITQLKEEEPDLEQIKTCI